MNIRVVTLYKFIFQKDEKGAITNLLQPLFVREFDATQGFFSEITSKNKVEKGTREYLI